MSDTIAIVRNWFENTYKLFTIDYPGLGISIIAVMLGVILIKLCIKLFYYSFGFSGGNVGRMARGDSHSIVKRKEDNSNA